MALDNTWYSEPCPDYGSAFSLKIKEKLHDETSDYQRIEVYDTVYFGKLMVIDGYIMLTDRDNFIYHEMMSHPALFTHPSPEKVVIIGGGDCGTLQEVLHHTEVKEAWQVEIDERVTRISEQYFSELCQANNDPRANFFFGDGIKWIEDVPEESIDVIIIDSTDPIGPAEGLFAAPFYRSCHKALKPNGLIVQQSESPLYHLQLIQDMYQAMKEAGFTNMATLQFPQSVYPSGWWSATMAGKDINVSKFRQDTAASKSFSTKFYSHDMHLAGLTLPPYVKETLNKLR